MRSQSENYQVALPNPANQGLAEIDWSSAFPVSEKAKLREKRHDGTMMYFADYTRYDGRLNKDGKREGQGKVTWSDGLVYLGDFKDGLRHGHGSQ